MSDEAEYEEEHTTDEFQKELNSLIKDVQANIDMVMLHGEYVEELYLACDYAGDARQKIKELEKLISDEDEKYEDDFE